jgi:hypothetical protein
VAERARPLVASLVLCATAALAAPRVPERLLEHAEPPPPGVTRVEVEVGTGSLVLRPSPDGRVHARVELEAAATDLKLARWRSGRAEAQVAAAALVVERRGESLKLRLSYPRPAGDQVRERWEVEVPDPIASSVRVNVGSADLRGLPGGVSVEVNVGDVRLSLGTGDARAHANVGNVIAEVDGEPFARAELSANLGEVSAELGGRRVPGRAALPPSSRLLLEGVGQAEYLLSANVGSVRLAVRAARPQP